MMSVTAVTNATCDRSQATEKLTVPTRGLGALVPFRLRSLQPQDLTDPEDSQDPLDPAGDRLGGLAQGENGGVDEVHDPPSMDEPAPTRGDDVPDPIDLVSIGERDQEAILVGEGVHGRSVDTSAGTAPMEDDTEVR
jgi:hypothetical protein